MSEQKIKVVLVRVGVAPEVAEIGRGLASFQEAIGGGYVQCVPFPDGQGGHTLGLWCDEEGLLKEMPRNRPVRELGQWIHGPFFITGSADSEGETMSVPESQIPLLLARFAVGATP